jgi:hypothetical protein
MCIRDRIYAYEDLDGDGTSEALWFNKDFLGYAAVLLKVGEKVPWQWNLDGEFCPGHFYFCADVNEDEVKDVFVFTHRMDSIFLNLYDVKNETEVFENLFIDTFDRSSGHVDFSVYHPQLVDLKNDESRQLLFVLGCAFSHTTRKLCLADYKTQKVKLSPQAGTGLTTKPILYDIDHDGKNEVLGEHHSPGNTSLSYPYSDQYAWIQVYDSNLQFKFPPVKMGHYPSRQTLLPIEVDGQPFLLGLFNHSGNKDTSFLALYSHTGQLLKQRNMEFPDGFTSTSLFLDDQFPGECILAYNTGEVYRVNADLEQTLIASFPPAHYYLNWWRYDLDGDGAEEMVFRTPEHQTWQVISKDYSHSLPFKVVPEMKHYFLSIKKENGKGPILVFSADERLLFYEYKQNPLFVLVWPIRIGLFLIIFAFLWLLTRVQQRYVLRKVESEKKIAALQISSIRNQITPHFTLNILNSIGALYATQNTAEADRAMGRYAKLLRQALLASDQVSILLKDELDFTKNFLELEKLRMNGRLKYAIDVCELVDTSLLVPKMMIHTFVENAIKHGVRHLPEETMGEVLIGLKMNQKQLLVTVDDSGVGRELAKQYSTFSTGKGLKILDEIFSLYKQLENREIHYKISNTPLYESGTRATLTISLN